MIVDVDFVDKILTMLVEKEIIDPNNYTLDEVTDFVDFFIAYLYLNGYPCNENIAKKSVYFERLKNLEVVQ